MTRGTLFASEFRPGDLVSVGDRTRSVRLTGEGLVFYNEGVPPLASFALPVDAPPVMVRRGLLDEPVSPWRYGLWSVTDTETTGLGPDDRIVEVAVVQMRLGLVVDAWSSLVNPGIPIPPEATAIHGITDAMVASAPTISALRPEIDKRLCASVATLGYNVYGYDEPIMASDGIGFPRPIVDVLPLVREHAVSWLTSLPAKRWKSESERRERDANDDDDGTDFATINWRRVGRHSLERAARELEQSDPEKGLASALHRAAWDAVLTGRVAWQLRGWLTEDAATLEPKLRDLLERQNASTQAFIATMRAKEAAARKPPDQRIREALAELRDVMALQSSYEAWMRGAKAPTEAGS